MPRAKKEEEVVVAPEVSEVAVPVVRKDENENKGAETLPLDVKRAIESGLPKLSGKESPAYLERHGVLVRFIKQSPHKWELEKVEQLRQLALL